MVHLLKLTKRELVGKILTNLVVFYFLISTNLCFAVDLQTNNLLDIKNILDKEANKETLVIFDVDDVLIAPTDAFAFRDSLRRKFNQGLKSRYTQQERKVIFSDFFKKRRVCLITPKIISLLDELRSQKIPTTALTRWYTGRYGTIEYMEDLRFKGLDDVGISFVDMSPFKKDFTFPELKTEDGIPMVRNGIIITAFADKGVSLLAALAKEKLNFRKIIFIDDDLTQLESVKKACKKIGVSFIGIHYTEAKLIPLPNLNEAREKLRFEILEKKKIWLTDNELEMHKK